jgi:hypothetical protein
VTEDERRRIESEAKAEADMLHKIDQNSRDIKSLETRINGYISRAITVLLAAIAYLVAQVWNFISGGGVIK